MKMRPRLKTLSVLLFLIFTLLLTGSMRRFPVAAVEEVPGACRAAAAFASELPEHDRSAWLKLAEHNSAILLNAALNE